MWKACSNIFPVMNNLKQKRVDVSGMCLICNEGVETVEHYLLTCKSARAVWFGSDLNYIVDVQQVTTFDARLGDRVKRLVLNKVCRAKILSYISFTCGLIWKIDVLPFMISKE